MNPLVTVAIAAYNVEKFLQDGIRSVLSQTYKNLEILIVDDGSTDSTPFLCDEIAKQDSRIRVIHKENGGLGSARNVGIDKAKGKYLYFFDVDDYIEPNLVEENVKIAEEKNSDLIIFGYYARFENENTEELISLKEHDIHSNEDLKRIYCDELLWMKHGNGFAWNKFYRLKFLKEYDFHFGDQRIQQDEPFNMQLYPKLNNVYISPKAYYHYVIYSNNNAGSRYLPNKADIITDVYHKFMDFYNDWDLDDVRVLNYIEKRFVGGMFSVATGNFFHKKCDLTKQEKKVKISETIHSKELVEVLKRTKLEYGSNPINNLQAWAFNHSFTGLLIIATRLKKFLKDIVRKSE